MKRIILCMGVLSVCILTACQSETTEDKTGDGAYSEVVMETIMPTKTVTKTYKPVVTATPTETATDGSIRITETMPPEYDVVYQGEIIASDGTINEELCEKIVKVNYGIGDTIHPVTDEAVVSQVVDCLRNVNYEEITEEFDPDNMRMGGVNVDFITESDGCVETHMLTDLVTINGKRYNVDESVISKIRPIVFSYLGLAN